MKGCIYALCDPDTGFPRYIGQTAYDPDARLYKHVWEAEHGYVGRKYNWIRSLSEPPKLIVLEKDPPSLDEAEKAWIHTYRSYGVSLCNANEGGGSNRGFKHTEETKRLLRSIRLEKPIKRPGWQHSEESKKKISESRKGGPSGSPWKGKNLSPEHRQHISDGMKRARSEKFWSTKKVGDS